MRPLPRLHAVTDAQVLAAPDFGIRAAAIAAAGPAVALHARDRAAGGAALARAAVRLVALARPPEAAVFVSGRPDVAAAVGAQGVQLAAGDLSPEDARRVFAAGDPSPTDARRVHAAGWIGRSVHGVDEAAAAVAEGADFLLVGNVYETPTHPGRPAAGLDLVRAAAALGRPVIAIGGIDAERAREARAAGAYGVAAIRALWRSDDPAAAALALLAPWAEAT
jgi:thiamine-phosphate pyrophosphorylase